MIKSVICELLGIERPIFQGGMAWIADAKLAAAVSNAGGLGLISSINFGTEAVREEIRKCKTLTDKPFGVNIMLQAPNAGEVADMIIEEGVKIVTTGAGSLYNVYQTYSSEFSVGATGVGLLTKAWFTSASEPTIQSVIQSGTLVVFHLSPSKWL